MNNMKKYIARNLSTNRYLTNVDSLSSFTVLEEDYRIFHTDDIKLASVFNNTEEAINAIQLLPYYLFEIITVYNLR